MMDQNLGEKFTHVVFDFLNEILIIFKYPKVSCFIIVDLINLYLGVSSMVVGPTHKALGIWMKF